MTHKRYEDMTHKKNLIPYTMSDEEVNLNFETCKRENNAIFTASFENTLLPDLNVRF